ncbi:extracellular solute-binding protein [Paenibacillus aceris]|uniref:Aldouronate transport system substrate-binding protein n=1 Tax=Paenibacillus aceris TaxID=869555 RepID=A0ABS4HUJ3_9BACL|nr:extracellular solute-binding protein [Paenibacillus aceris]MBP1962294.1 putative aldouronate transport system substrate-binding protein [Paenibacillus aceris]NHW37120.1 extracellular solute-binding protein [Paenibacillus aceris]
MNKWKKTTAFGLVACTLVFASACSSTNSQEAAQSPTTSTSPTNSEKKIVQLTTVRSNPSDIKWDPGESMDKNSVYDAYEQDLGIRIKNMWVADSKQFAQKLNMMIASNDIPDFFSVADQVQLQQLVDADMLMDMSAIFDKYASSETKEWFTKDGGNQMKSAKVDGKLMAIPLTADPYGSSSYLWVRKDWLSKLNLPEPKTMQDVLKISEEFTKKDPGGTGKSFGLTLQKDLLDDYGLTGFFNGYHAYPGIWQKGTDGKLVYGSIQPQMKVALKQLQDMYKSGQIDPEFGAKDPDKENELVAANKIGMAYGAFYLSAWPLASAAIKDGKLVQDWQVYGLPSIDGTAAKSQIGLGVNGYVVVSKNCKNPEAVIQILNQWIKLQISMTDKERVYINGKELEDKGKLYFKVNPIRLFAQDGNVQAGGILPKAIESKDPSMLKNDPDLMNRYAAAQNYLKGDVSGWFHWMIAKSGGSFSIMNQYLKDSRYEQDQFFGAPTQTMQDKKSVLDAKEKEIFTKIIMNQVSIDEFDKFVADWNNLGGEKITKEVNDWYTKQK